MRSKGFDNTGDIRRVKKTLAKPLGKSEPVLNEVNARRDLEKVIQITFNFSIMNTFWG